MKPLDPRDYARQRRDRRLHRNLDRTTAAQAWATAHGLSLRVNNDGHHWMFQRPGFVAEWWPSSAKLVFNRNYDRDVHAHDLPQVLAVLESHLNPEP